MFEIRWHRVSHEDGGRMSKDMVKAFVSGAMCGSVGEMTLDEYGLMGDGLSIGIPGDVLLAVTGGWTPEELADAVTAECGVPGILMTLQKPGEEPSPKMLLLNAQLTRFRHELIPEIIVRRDVGCSRVNLNAQERLVVWSKTNGHCVYCRTDLRDEDTCFEVDHIVPLSGGGSNDVGNLLPSCDRCNASKGTASLMEFLERFHKVVERTVADGYAEGVKASRAEIARLEARIAELEGATQSPVQAAE